MWSDLEGRVGERVTLAGTALDAAAGAIVSLDGFPVYVAGLRGWPPGAVRAGGRGATGTLVFRPGAPRGVHGPADTYALEDASWSRASR